MLHLAASDLGLQFFSISLCGTIGMNGVVAIVWRADVSNKLPSLILLLQIN